MGTTEDRFDIEEWKRQSEANQVKEIMVPGHGIWTKEGLKALLDDDRDRKRQEQHQADEEAKFYGKLNQAYNDIVDEHLERRKD